VRKVQCPECNAISFEGFLTYPLCHKCHTNLTACSYCTRFPGEGETCRHHPQAGAIAVDTVVTGCRHRRSRLYVDERAQSGPLRGVVLASLLVCTIFGLVVTAASLVTMPPEMPSRLTVRARCPRYAKVGEIIQAKFFIERETKGTSQFVKLRVPNGFFDDFKCVRLSPRAELVQPGGHYRYYYFHFSPETRRLEVLMDLQPLRDGKHRLEASVYTSANEYQGGLSHAIAVAPMVAESPNSSMSFLPDLERLGVDVTASR